jgi:predicted methyltransferase
METDEEIRKILNDTDIDRLRKRFLCFLKDMDNGANNHYEFNQIYEQMGLSGYNLPLAMRIVIQNFLLSQELVEIDGDRVKITEKGRHRCDQFRQTDDYDWNDTMNKMDRYRR